MTMMDDTALLHHPSIEQNSEFAIKVFIILFLKKKKLVKIVRSSKGIPNCQEAHNTRMEVIRPRVGTCQSCFQTV